VAEQFLGIFWVKFPRREVIAEFVSIDMNALSQGNFASCFERSPTTLIVVLCRRPHSIYSSRMFGTGHWNHGVQLSAIVIDRRAADNSRVSPSSASLSVSAKRVLLALCSLIVAWVCQEDVSGFFVWRRRASNEK